MQAMQPMTATPGQEWVAGPDPNDWADETYWDPNQMAAPQGAPQMGQMPVPQQPVMPEYDPNVGYDPNAYQQPAPVQSYVNVQPQPSREYEEVSNAHRFPEPDVEAW